MDGYTTAYFIKNQERKLCSPVYYFEKPPAEEMGVCQSCGILDIVGNGLCVKCWDEFMTSKKGQSRSGRVSKGVEPVERTKRIKKEVVTKRKSWSKGLTKYDHPGLMRISEKMTGQRVRLGIKNKPINPQS